MKYEAPNAIVVLFENKADVLCSGGIPDCCSNNPSYGTYSYLDVNG